MMKTNIRMSSKIQKNLQTREAVTTFLRALTNPVKTETFYSLSLKVIDELTLNLGCSVGVGEAASVT